MKDNFQACCNVTLDYEGGNDDDVHDPGGRTSRGITQSEYNIWRGNHPGLSPDVWKAPQATIVDIYREKYWNPVAGDTWPRGFDLVVYDAGVNSGLGKALAWSRYTLGVNTGALPELAALGTRVNDRVGFVKRFQARRLSFLENLGTWRYFGTGWSRRVAGIEALALKMVATGANLSPGEVLEPERVKASRKKTTAGGAATGVSGASGSGVSLIDVHNWADILIIAGVSIAAIALVLWLVHHWRIQSARAQALKDAQK